MAKKILILSGSPRKNGNSDYLCEKFFEGAKDAGHDVEKIFISAKKLLTAVPVTLAKKLESALSMMIWLKFFRKSLTPMF